jgi:hypothetical protein
VALAKRAGLIKEPELILFRNRKERRLLLLFIVEPQPQEFTNEPFEAPSIRRRGFLDGRARPSKLSIRFYR